MTIILFFVIIAGILKGFEIIHLTRIGKLPAAMSEPCSKGWFF